MGDHGPDCLCDSCLRDAPRCPCCRMAWRDHPGPTNMCEEIQRITEERDYARKSLHLAYRVLRLTIPRPHGCLCDACLEALLVDDTIGTYQQLMRLTAQCTGRAATIRRLLEERDGAVAEVQKMMELLSLALGRDEMKLALALRSCHKEIKQLKADLDRALFG